MTDIDPKKIPRDFTGRPIPDGEPLDKKIHVRKIVTVPPDQEFDYCLIRSYQEAIEYAQVEVENRMDRYEPEEGDPIVITISHVEMTLEQFQGGDSG